MHLMANSVQTYSPQVRIKYIYLASKSYRLFWNTLYIDTVVHVIWCCPCDELKKFCSVLEYIIHGISQLKLCEYLWIFIEKGEGIIRILQWSDLSCKGHLLILQRGERNYLVILFRKWCTNAIPFIISFSVNNKLIYNSLAFYNYPIKHHPIQKWWCSHSIIPPFCHPTP